MLYYKNSPLPLVYTEDPPKTAMNVLTIDACVENQSSLKYILRVMRDEKENRRLNLDCLTNTGNSLVYKTLMQIKNACDTYFQITSRQTQALHYKWDLLEPEDDQRAEYVRYTWFFIADTDVQSVLYNLCT